MKNQADTPASQRRVVPLLIILLSVFAIGGLAWYGPIPQDPAYHDFADRRTVLSVPNFWNVASNLPFVLVGILGLLRCRSLPSGLPGAENSTSYMVFFAAVLLVGMGSGYYHLRPDNWGLAWDRLPMALSFMAFLSIIIGEYVSAKQGRRLLLPLSLFGLVSVVYWIITEQNGAGDLRLYAITQFLPLLVIAGIIFSRRSETIRRSDMLIIAAGYVLAKLFEFLDVHIYQALLVSGHTLKHLAAATSAFWLLPILDRRLKELQVLNIRKKEEPHA